MRQPFCVVIVLALAGVVAFAAPVPKAAKVDPAKLYGFPDLEAKEWKTFDNGLKVWEVKPGDGEELKGGNESVVVNYVGWLSDGKKFDSSLDRNEPTKYRLDGQIKGWQDGMVGMKPGGVRRLLVPPDLAYGKRGVSGLIPENTDLVFFVEYLGRGENK